jgi:hypothetical protein
MSSTKIGHQFANFTSGTTATAVFLPAANANGAYLRTGTIVATSTSVGSSIIIVADTAPPSSAGDASKRIIFNALSNVNTGASFVLPHEFYVPAGWGVWVVSGTATWGVGITFDTLT